LVCKTTALLQVHTVSKTYNEFSLVFFITFEPISLGVSMLYERAATVLPSLYVCPVANLNVLGRVPLIPCYLNGNTSNTIPFRYRGAILPEAAADSRPYRDIGTSSRLFEINRLMWHYGRTFPRKISVADTVAMQKQRVQESSLSALGPVAATLQRRREQATLARAAGSQ
jgi:hypothetical protein